MQQNIDLDTGRPWTSDEREAQDAEQYSMSPERDTIDETSDKKKLLVIIGSGIIQLPIWGFAMTYGVFQEYYSIHWTLSGSQSTTSVIGMTQNGVMYISMPFLFVLFSRRWAHRRQLAALCGTLLACLSFLLSSYSTHAWHLVATQGILAAMRCALVYSPMTLSLGDWYISSNRAVAYGVVLSCKNIVGSACPFLLRALLNRYGFRIALRTWAAIVAVTSSVSISMVPAHPSTTQRPRKLPWGFLKHQTIWIYSIAILCQSCGYGIPQTYLNQYAHEVILLSEGSAMLLLTLFNLPGIASSAFFGYLSDNRRFPLSAGTVTAISAVSSGLAAVLFWGLTTRGSSTLLIIFSISFGYFAGGYSGTWGGIINELEREAAQNNEAVDAGMLYGLLNGARGVGYVIGGLTSVPLAKAGAIGSRGGGGFGYGTAYGALILFTGLSTVFGGLGLLWRLGRTLS